MPITAPPRRLVLPRVVGRHLGATLLAIALAAATPLAHDLFLKPEAFRVAAGAPITASVLSGTFSKSENAITRDRLADLSLVTPAGRTAIPQTQWTAREPRSTLRVATTAPGTYVLGAAVRPRLLSLDGPAFNAYLKEEGLEDILAARQAQGRLAEASRERYAKYVKALVQVGTTETDTHATDLGYDAELIPLANPYRLTVGDVLRVRCLVDRAPAAGLVVFAGGRTPTGGRLPVQRLVADAEGVVTVRLTSAGAWYVKFVHMREVKEPDATYESRWSTVTFGIR